MQASCRWERGLQFTGNAGDHQVTMDTRPPLGTNAGMSPKQMVLVGLCGCTAMDVAAHLRKHRQPLDSLEVAADAPTTTGQPSVFHDVQLVYTVTGAVAAEVLLDAVRESQSMYCGVSAMIAKACPIGYTVRLNGEEIGKGAANF
jgi:putative redox protein